MDQTANTLTVFEKNRFPHHQEGLLPDNKRKPRNKRGRSKKYKLSRNAGEVGLLVGCPAGYSLQDSHCLPCAAGFYSEDGSSNCKECPLGCHQRSTESQTCRHCNNPFIEGCHDMLWDSSTIILIIVVAVCAAVVISIIVMLIFICVRRKCREKRYKLDDTVYIPKHCNDEIPLLEQKESTDDADKFNGDIKHRTSGRVFKKKYKKSIDNRRVERNFVLVDKRELNTNDNEGKRKQKRKIIGFQYVPVACFESYRSHRENCDNDFPTIPKLKKPPVPLPDFDKDIHNL